MILPDEDARYWSRSETITNVFHSRFVAERSERNVSKMKKENTCKSTTPPTRKRKRRHGRTLRAAVLLIICGAAFFFAEPIEAAAEPMAESTAVFGEQEASNPDPFPAGAVLPEGESAEELLGYFTISPITPGDAVYDRINQKSWQENPDIGLDELRYCKLLHYNFEGQIQVGELIVHQSIAEDVRSIFLELFAAGYQIQSMRLIDEYWTGDPEDSDTASVDANNSSAFCYRPATDGKKLSKHAYGKAIDINPQQNPYVSYASGFPRWYHENANAYIRRDTGLPHVITHEDTAFLVFSKYGFFWGGDWRVQKDYQHFQKE